MYEPQSSDTRTSADQVHFDILRKMSAQERLALMTQLTLSVQRLAFTGLRSKYPDSTDDEIWLRLAAKRLGADRVAKIYAWRADDE